MNEYLSGRKLFGDDFSADQIERWYEEEREGYASLGASDRAAYRYEYHAMNEGFGFKHLPSGSLGRVLGIGSAYGDELLPVASRIEQLTILEPSVALRQDRLGGVPIEYITPHSSGAMPLESKSFDTVSCFGVLHHIPNVTHVVKEIARVMKPGGFALVREPIVSMGDWRHHRPGATKNERGIPLALFRQTIRDAGFRVKKETLCGFRPFVVACQKVGMWPWQHSWQAATDAILSKAFAFNTRYHATTAWHVLRSTSVFYVLVKD